MQPNGDQLEIWQSLLGEKFLKIKPKRIVSVQSYSAICICQSHPKTEQLGCELLLTKLSGNVVLVRVVKIPVGRSIQLRKINVTPLLFIGVKLPFSKDRGRR